MADLIVGLDIGTTKVCAVVGEMAENGLVDVVGIGTRPSHGMRKGVVVNIEQTVQSIRGAIEDAELMAGCEINSVYVGIAGGQPWRHRRQGRRSGPARCGTRARCGPCRGHPCGP